MKKRLLLSIIIVLSVFLVCSCGNKENQTNESEPSEINTNSAIQEENVTESSMETAYTSEKNMEQKISFSYTSKDIESFLMLHKDELLLKYGSDYIADKVGPEMYYDGYYYKNLGITFGFAEDRLEYILFDKDVKVDGIASNMSFEQVQSVKGRNDIVEGYGEDMTTMYDIVYDNDLFDLCFYSQNAKGGNLSIEVRRDAKVFETTETEIKRYLLLNEEEFLNKMKGQYYEIVNDAGVNHDRKGYYFERYSLTFVFDDKKQIEWIEPGYGFKFNGEALDGDSLDSVRTLLGNPTTQEVIDEANGIFNYVYNFDGFTINCITISKESPFCNILIKKVP